MATKRPTMADVAEEARVGLKTVSRVVNNEPGVSKGTSQRVRDAIVATGFRRNDLAAALKAGRSASSVGLIIEDIGNPFYSVIARAIEQEVSHRGLVLVTASSEERGERERELLIELSQQRVLGMIVVPTSIDHGFLDNEIAMGMQFVFIDRPAAGIEADTALLDNRGGAVAATEHLVAAGHTRIAIIGHDADIWTMKERVAGYQLALRDAGIPIDVHLERLGPATPEEAAAAAGELLDLPAPPTAFFGANNRMTIGILLELRSRGIVVDVAGFDDIETAGIFSQPVTLVTYDAGRLGRVGTRMLMERLDGRKTVKRIVVPTTLTHYGV